LYWLCFRLIVCLIFSSCNPLSFHLFASFTSMMLLIFVHVRHLPTSKKIRPHDPQVGQLNNSTIPRKIAMVRIVPLRPHVLTKFPSGQSEYQWIWVHTISFPVTSFFNLPHFPTAQLWKQLYSTPFSDCIPAMPVPRSKPSRAYDYYTNLASIPTVLLWMKDTVHVEITQLENNSNLTTLSLLTCSQTIPFYPQPLFRKPLFRTQNILDSHQKLHIG